MPKAYVMITSDEGFGDETVTALRKIKGVKTAEKLYGVYDLVVIVEVPTLIELEKAVISNIRNVEGVSHTLTMLVAGKE